MNRFKQNFSFVEIEVELVRALVRVYCLHWEIGEIVQWGRKQQQNVEDFFLFAVSWCCY